MKPKEYTGSCYVGVVGPEGEIGECRDSIESMRRQSADEFPVFSRGTKGYETRQLHFERWYGETRHPFALLLDHDMLYPPDTLERLRSHKLPYVSGYYLRRRYAPIAPVWFEYGPRGVFPLKPWTVEPERGRLHKLGASGWGCILIHREVVDAVNVILKGEMLVAEDDMDIWPYDLDKVMGAVKGLNDLADAPPDHRNLLLALKAHALTLAQEIRVLRGSKTPIGSDLRFPFYAREAGYTLMGDPDVRPGHMVNFPLSPDEYTAMPDELRGKNTEAVLRGWSEERKNIRRKRENLNK